MESRLETILALAGDADEIEWIERIIIRRGRKQVKPKEQEAEGPPEGTIEESILPTMGIQSSSPSRSSTPTLESNDVIVTPVDRPVNPGG